MRELLTQSKKLTRDLDSEIFEIRRFRIEQEPLLSHKDRHLDLLGDREEEKLGLNKTLELKVQKLVNTTSEINFRMNQDEMELLRL